MSVSQTIADQIDYLVRSTGRPEAEILAEAIETGLTALYAKRVEEAYLAGEIDRGRAVRELGEDAVDDLDYARHAVQQDVSWGLNRD